MVPVDSALGLVLGGREWPYLAAGREWRVGDETLPGSWYRPHHDDPRSERPWTYLHHIDQQYDPAVARSIAESLLGTAGPEAGSLPQDMSAGGARANLVLSLYDDFGGLGAAAVLITLPVIILTLIIQRWIVTGLTMGAVKG